MDHNGKGLFALEKLNSSLKGYYMDGDNTVYSTRTKCTPQIIMGAKTSQGRVYTLDRRTYTSTFLVVLAKKHKDFYVDTRIITVTENTKMLKGSPSDRSHAKSLQEGLDYKGWVIAQVSVHDGVQHLLFGSQPAIHITPGSVTSELQRLATSKPGVKFVSLKVDRTLVSGGLVWN